MVQLRAVTLLIKLLIWFRNVWVGPLDDFVCDSLLVISKDCVHYLTIAMVPKVQPVGQIRTEKDSNPTRELS